MNTVSLKFPVRSPAILCARRASTKGGLASPPFSLRHAVNLETLDIGVGQVWIEYLAHDRVFGRGGLVRRVTQFFLDTITACREIDLLRHRLVVHLTLEMSPALHLGEDPDRHGMPGIGIKVDPVRD